MSKFIVKIDFTGTGEKQSVENRFYLRFPASGGAEELWNPNFATEFDSKEEALNAIETNTTLEDRFSVVKAQAERQKWQMWINGDEVRRTYLPPSILSRKYNGEDRSAVLDWHIEYRKFHAQNKDSTVSYSNYKTWQILSSMFKHIFESKLLGKNNNNDLQPSFSMRVDYNSEFSTFKEEFDLIKDKIGAFKDGEKFIDIFDHDLSASGCPYFVIKPNGKYTIRYIRYSRWDKDEIEGTLEEVFEHWRKNNWYCGGPETDDYY